MKIIHSHIKELKIYLEHTICSMDNYLTFSSSLPTHEMFNQTLREKMGDLKRIQEKIHRITDYNMFNFGKIKEIGYVFKCFYELHSDKEYNDAILYSLGFNGYVDCLQGLQQNIASGFIHFCSFISNPKKTVFSQSYYANLKNKEPVKNTISLKKNMIITGPNASGKTTVLKATLINAILSQQFGCGFYDEQTRLSPFSHFHCYLNIPDTSGRDSLFQAEARRCKQILDDVEREKGAHFCVFDELYSGTNPEEAEQSASSFMKYMVKYKHVHCMLTTHFIKVCTQLKHLKTIENVRMVTHKDEREHKLKYTYLIEKGISNIKGGIVVLKQMNYPKEIIDSACNEK